MLLFFQGILLGGAVGFVACFVYHVYVLVDELFFADDEGDDEGGLRSSSPP